MASQFVSVNNNLNNVKPKTAYQFGIKMISLLMVNVNLSSQIYLN